MKRACVIAMMLCATVAHAAPHAVLVLRAEGTADVATRTNVDTHVLRLARNIDGKVEAGDITLTDAAAAAGCNASDAVCKDEILATFAVDEIVTTTVTSSGGQHTVIVRRLRRGSTPKVASSRVAPNIAFEKALDTDVGPLFGVRASTPEPKPAAPTKATATTQPKGEPAISETPPAPPAEPMPADPYATTPTDVTQPAAAAPVVTTPADAPQVDRRTQKIGLIVGGSLVILGAIMWGKAGSTQDKIDAAPTSTSADFVALRQLESDADGQAGLGNLFFLGGVVVGGISGYYYWKKGRQARTQTARVHPTVFPNGAGVVLSFGGSR